MKFYAVIKLWSETEISIEKIFFDKQEAQEFILKQDCPLRYKIIERELELKLK